MLRTHVIFARKTYLSGDVFVDRGRDRHVRVGELSHKPYRNPYDVEVRALRNAYVLSTYSNRPLGH